MTYATSISRGQGRWAWRLQISGWPYEFVTNPSMTGSYGGRTRLDGLRFNDTKFEEKIDPVTGKFDVSGIQLTIADIDELVTLALAQRPSQNAFLTATVNSSATTIPNVTSTTGWPSSGTFWIDSEAITYSGVTATSFTGCTRGALGTKAQYHYADLGARLRYPEITNYPQLMRGRRARLYIYAEGDDKTGDGTQVWLGTISAEPAYNGVEWSLMMDPIVSILEQELGADIADPLRPRGIYFPDDAAFQFYIRECSTSAFPWSGGTVALSARVGPVSGFWETQEEFCAYIQTLIDAAQTGAGMTTKLLITSDGSAGYHFTIQTPGASPKALTISQVLSWDTEPKFAERGGVADVVGNTGAVMSSVSTSSEYYIFGDPTRDRGETGMHTGLGTVPRGIFDPGNRPYNVAADSVAYPDRVIYLGGVTSVPSYTTQALIKWGDDEVEYGVRDIDTATKSITLTDPPGDETFALEGIGAFTADPAPEIRLGRSFNASIGERHNHLGDLLTTLVANSAQYANAGAQPFLEIDDFDLDVWTAALRGMPRYISWRSYSFFAPIKLTDLIVAELQLAGYFLALDSEGKLVIRPYRLPLSTDASIGTIVANTLLTDDGLPTYERAGFGLINTVIVKTGYSPPDDEWKGPPVVIRDVSAHGQSSTANALIIEPRSRDPWATGGQILEDMTGAAQRLLGVFASPYAVCQLSVPLTFISTALCGSTIKVTSKHIPNDDGTKGVTARPALIVGREVVFGQGRINLTVLMASGRIGGYAPAVQVSTQVNSSGNTWVITTSPNGHFSAGEDAADWYQVGDKVRVHVWDSSTVTTTVAGTVTAVSGDDVTVEFSGAWTPGSYSWVLSYDLTSAPQQTSQRIFAALADDTGRLTYDSANDVAAFTFTA